MRASGLASEGIKLHQLIREKEKVSGESYSHDCAANFFSSPQLFSFLSHFGSVRFNHLLSRLLDMPIRPVVWNNPINDSIVAINRTIKQRRTVINNENVVRIQTADIRTSFTCLRQSA